MKNTIRSFCGLIQLHPRISRTSGQLIGPSLNDYDALIVVQKYRHYKGGEYISLGKGIHTETEENLVFYFSLENHKLYARPKDMFYSDVEWEGRVMKRFTLVD